MDLHASSILITACASTEARVFLMRRFRVFCSARRFLAANSDAFLFLLTVQGVTLLPSFVTMSEHASRRVSKDPKGRGGPVRGDCCVSMCTATLGRNARVCEAKAQKAQQQH